MQHPGWLAEEVAELGGYPLIKHTEMTLDGTPEEMLQADIDAERAVTMEYTRQLHEIEDEKLHTLVSRVRDHEIYHGEVFSDLLAEVEERPGGK